VGCEGVISDCSIILTSLSPLTSLRGVTAWSLRTRGAIRSADTSFAAASYPGTWHSYEAQLLSTPSRTRNKSRDDLAERANARTVTNSPRTPSGVGTLQKKSCGSVTGPGPGFPGPAWPTETTGTRRDTS